MEYAYPEFRREQLREDVAFHGGPQPGERLPDFDLPHVGAGRVRSAELRGRPLLLTFGSFT
jgi:hypothetical protein